jgi:hypothetical protein
VHRIACPLKVFCSGAGYYADTTVSVKVHIVKSRDDACGPRLVNVRMARQGKSVLGLADSLLYSRTTTVIHPFSQR